MGRAGELRREPTPPGPITELFDELHEAHFHAGAPALRQIERDIKKVVKYSTIHKVFKGPQVPLWGQLEVIVKALGGDTSHFKELWKAAQREAKAIGPITAEAILADAREQADRIIAEARERGLAIRANATRYAVEKRAAARAEAKNIIADARQKAEALLPQVGMRAEMLHQAVPDPAPDQLSYQPRYVRLPDQTPDPAPPQGSRRAGSPDPEDGRDAPARHR